MAGRTRTAKALAKRIDMEYFKRLHPFRRWRLILSIAAPVVVLLFIGSLTAAGSRAPFSSGPLSLAHQVFGQRCERCHATPLPGTQSFRAHVTDMTCVACHEAPAHKPNQTFTPACATCHLDHRGAIKLAAVDNQFCEQCHRDLKLSAGALGVAQTVGPFENGHPEFAVRRPGAADRAVLGFNHEVHLKSDLRGPGGPTKLECATCHKPAATGGGRPSAGSSDVTTPVTYAANCASCHPLYFDPLIDAVVPHDTPDKVNAFVAQSLQEFIASNPEQIGKVEPARGRIPVSFPVPVEAIELAQTAEAWTTQRTAMVERLLWSKTCAECHTIESPTAALPRVVPTNMAKNWMPHARFDHRAHQLATCTSCHAASTSRNTSDVLMPSIAVCQQCHKPNNGAEARCFECHEYHDWTKAKPAAVGLDLRQITN